MKVLIIIFILILSGIIFKIYCDKCFKNGGKIRAINRNVNGGCTKSSNSDVYSNDVYFNDVYSNDVYSPNLRGYGMHKDYPVIINSNIIPPYPNFNISLYSDKTRSESPFEYRQNMKSSSCY